MAGPRTRRARLARGTLSREIIVTAALGILDKDGPEGLTFNRLGAELAASSTSVYRHFSSRDQLVVAIAEELDRISLDGYVPHEDWRESLRDLATRAWGTAMRHPAAAALCMHRVTRGIHELKAVDAVLEAVHRAGWQGREAVLHYSAFVGLVLAVSGHHAARALDIAAAGAEGWVQEYSPTDPSAYPHARAAAEHLRTLDEEEVFARQVEAVIAAMSRPVREIADDAEPGNRQAG